MNAKAERVLVVAAHPDDEVLGCGGTIARLADEGHKVHIVILGEGITSRYQAADQAEQKLIEQLHEHSRRAGTILGAASVEFASLPDNRFDTMPLLDVIKVVERYVEAYCPSVVYTHHGSDLNVDHVITHRAVLTATRPMKGHCVKEAYAFEIASSSEWNFGGGNPFEPNVFMDITESLERKIAAMEAYEGEIRDFPHPRSSQALQAIATRWGSASGVEAAEAFVLVRAVK